MFTIAVVDEKVERIWLEHDLAGVTFYRDDDPNSPIDGTPPLEPDPGETISVGIIVNTHVASDSREEINVRVEYAEDEDSDDSDDERTATPTLEPTSVDLSATELEAGDALVVTATYENYGERAARVPVELTVDGVVVDRTTIVVGPGETETVSFERSMDLVGTFEVGIGGRTKTVTVSESADGANVTVADVSLEEERIRPGESVVTTATFENHGNRTGNVTAELAIGGVVLETRALAIGPGDERTVTFERPLERPGEYAVAVSGAEAGTVTVREPFVTVGNRELTSSTAMAIAPPAMVGLLFLVGRMGRRE